MNAVAERASLRLTRSQLYPRGRPMDPEFLVERRPILDRTTPIASMGSCFAANIKTFLVRRGFNYVQTSRAPGSNVASAAWGLVFNTFSIAQEFARAENQFEPVEREWPDGNGGLLDPYRRKVGWPDRETANTERADHALAARRAIQEAKVFVLTLGLIEVWFNRKDSAVFWQVPPRRVFGPECHGFHVSSVEENVKNVRASLERLWRLNPECQVILTVSPVPLKATFRPMNVMTANLQSKATLLLAADQIVAEYPERVHYFPSYELVTVFPGNPFRPDNRHVRREVLRRVFRLFVRSFVR